MNFYDILFARATANNADPQTVAAIAAAISAKGGIVAEGDGLAQFPGDIYTIPPIAMDDYNTIAEIVRAGKAPDVFHIGDQISTTYTDTAGNEYEMPWDIVAFRDVTLESGDIVPGMIIQSHYATVEEIQFDAAEPERPASADYNGQIAQYGWNRYKNSAHRQWLNSLALAGNWWAAQNEYDAAPTQASTVNGFLHGLPAEFLAMLKPVRVETVRNYRDPDTAKSSSVYEYDTVYDTMWLPSREEEYIVANEPNHREGTTWQYWINTLTPEATEKGEPLPQQTYASAEATHALSSHRRFPLNNKQGSAVVCRLRSANRYTSGNAWNVSTSGSVSTSNAGNSYRSAPACAIC